MESTVHAIWECVAAQDVWAGSSINLQKCLTNQCDIIQLFEFLFDRLSDADFEWFLVQSWLIWNQRNKVVHGRQMMDPRGLNKRALDYLDEAIIRNEEGVVMARMSVKGPLVHNSAEAEVLACRRAIQFSIEAGFSRLVIEGDNALVMHVISCSAEKNSLLGHIFEDIQHLVRGLQYASISCIKRGGNMVAHSLARHARTISDEMYWMEDSSSPAVDTLYHDLLHINE
ncbi:uncharacterized protein LOC142635170 [Castanea sativa]|uniref:uncharacterized protein LOC142635170 n=1 Tax=Castanea sativa TaxID=21020 RepID=UPI003F64EAF2